MSRTLQDLQMLQALPLDLKIPMTKARIRQWVNEFGEEGVYVSFSGGKDSTVLLHLIREMYPRVPAVFCDTGLEYPEIRDFVKTFDNVTWLRPEMNFRQVIEKYGYPFISKEVSECVYGARKYLTAVLNEQGFDRQTDRQPYSYCYDRLCGLGEFAKNDEGGADNKYRKLRGIGEFSKEKLHQNDRQHSGAAAHGNTSDERESDSGDYP